MTESIRKIIKDLILIITILTTGFGGLIDMGSEPVTPPDSNYPIGEAKLVEDGNFYWPEEKIFPSFAEPTEELIAFPGDILPHLEMTALSCLQGFVNRIGTKVVILDSDVEKWLSEYGYSYRRVERDDVFREIAELTDGAVAGVVLYDNSLNDNYMNLASSIGNTMNALPLTAEAYDNWKANGIDLPVLADIRGLKYDNPTEIYKYFFDNYWENCNKKILVVQRPDLSFHMRDLASATGGAVVYLSCSGGSETLMFKKFLSTMKPGESILTGWYAGQERELMTVAAQCGLSCVPADFFSNPTVFAKNREIKVPAVPDMPELENKIYIAYFLSDGDNIQYDMHAMREYWDNNRHNQGKVPVNWTISPALTDIAPEMMNYYYKGATDTECFVCGPSGMGYTMPKNTYGANPGTQFRSSEKFKAYVNMTDRYLQKSGLRVVTIWDNLTSAHRRIYTSESDYLYGLTVQNFTDSSLWKLYTGVTNDTLIIQMTPGYLAQNAEGNLPITAIENDIIPAIDFLRFNGKVPVFVATQVSVWAFHDINEVAKLEQHLSDHYAEIYGKDVVEFVRADHFYNLYYEAKKLPQDITLKKELTVTATSNSENANLVADGTCQSESVWTSDEEGTQTLTVSLGETYELQEITLYHAECSGFDKTLNSEAFTVEIGTDAEDFRKVADVKGNSESTTNLRFKKAKGNTVKITITNPGEDNIARLADIDIWGTLIK